MGEKPINEEGNQDTGFSIDFAAEIDKAQGGAEASGRVAPDTRDPLEQAAAVDILARRSDNPAAVRDLDAIREDFLNKAQDREDAVDTRDPTVQATAVEKLARESDNPAAAQDLMAVRQRFLD